jgi:hypothetical protein
MSLTPTEAASALRDIEDTGRRSGQAFGYRTSAPHLIIWGLVWVIGYSGSDLVPRYNNVTWLTVVALGTIASLVAGTVVGKANRSDRKNEGWRYGLLILVFWVFLIGTAAIMHPDAREQGAFIPLVIAAIYAGVGLWAGMRYILLGTAVAALTLFGFFEIQQHFALWMAAVGGGGLIVAGLWMRSA